MPSPLHIIFCGTPPIAVPTLKALHDDPRFAVDLVITQPDRPVGRKKEITPPALKVAAEAFKLPVFQPESLNKEWHAFQTSHPDILRPDFLVVIAYGQILSQELLNLPTIASINVHASLLPQYRGASPVQHVILHGDRESGITIQKMVQKLDAGPILAQESITLDHRETTSSLLEKCAALSASLVPRTLLAPLAPVEQDHSKATFCAKLSRADGLIDPQEMTAEEIDRRVRALNPWPGVTWQNAKILETSLALSEDAYDLSCRDASHLFITKIQPAGGKTMSGAEYERGRKK